MPSPSEGAGTQRARPGIDDGVSAAGRAHVEQIQRSRLLTAMVEVASEHGLADATIARVVARAGVSRRTFYELFEDREDCFLAALDEQIARASRCVLDGYEPEAKWELRLRGALASLLSFLDAKRAAGRLLIVGSLGAGAKAHERRQRVLAQIVEVVDEGRVEAGTGLPRGGQAEPPPLTAEGLVGGALSIVHMRLFESHAESLVELTNPLMSMIVLPYLGPAAARRELGRPVPGRPNRAERGGGGALHELDMRLTYRTVRVLMSVAANSGSSNREVGEAAGIVDQGQISKLLGRLERLGLVHNTGLAPGRGAPNAWRLTTKGSEVERAMGADCDEPHLTASERVIR
jgi:AcrR family transcriptional regulator